MSKPTIIHVARQQIAANAKHGTNEPALIIRRGRKSTRHHAVEILGPSRMVYQPHDPLPCGARAWIEVDPSIEVRAS